MEEEGDGGWGGEGGKKGLGDVEAGGRGKGVEWGVGVRG